MEGRFEEVSLSDLKHFLYLANERTREEPYNPDIRDTARNLEWRLHCANLGYPQYAFSRQIPTRQPDAPKTHSDDPVEQFLIDSRLIEYQDVLNRRGYAIMQWDPSFRAKDAAEQFCDRHYTLADVDPDVQGFHYWAVDLIEDFHKDKLRIRYFASKQFYEPGTIIEDWRRMVKIHEKNIGNIVMPALVFPGKERELIAVFKDDKTGTARAAYLAEKKQVDRSAFLQDKWQSLGCYGVEREGGWIGPC